MKKIIFLFLLVATTQLMAQPRQGTVEYDKQQVPCYITEFSFSPSVAEDAVRDRFKKMGIIAKEKKGFWECRNVVIPEISNSPIDVLFKVEKKSRKEKDVTVMYLIVNPIGVTEAATTAVAVQDFSAGSNAFLNSFQNNIQDYSFELEIKKQEEEVKKAEKRYKNLVEDGDDLQKKLKRLQDDIAENIKKQADQTAELQKQRDALTQMMSRRRAS